MSSVRVRGLVLALVAVGVAGPALAQRASESRWVVGGDFGGASAAKSLASGLDWRTGWSAGANLTYWLRSNFGVRGSAMFAQNNLRGTGGTLTTTPTKFNKFSYVGEAVLRAPGAAMKSIEPYALGGIGAVSVHQKGSDSTFTRFAGDVGAGVGYRLGRVGIRAEGRDLIYKFNRFGFDRTQHDIVWDGGLTLTL